MKILLVFLGLTISVMGQSKMNYTASSEHPFGLLNPESPAEVADYAPLIGVCNCTSIARNPDQSWAEPQSMT